jgi:hypothetical protein
LDIAFHFDADVIHAEYPDLPYNLPILDKLFLSLLMANFHKLHFKIFEGDLLVDDYFYNQTEERIQKLLEGLIGIDFRTWRDIDKPKLWETIFSSRVYVIFLQSMNSYVRDYLIRIFKEEKSYIGAIEILGINNVQWLFYSQKLIPKYRYVDRELRILNTMSDEGGKDTGLETFWKELPFKSVQWEDLGLRHTPFDVYEAFDHAALLAKLNDVVSDHLTQVAGEVLLRIGDLNPGLQNTLHSAFRTFYMVQTSEDIAQVALSCRRFLTGLADALYPPRDEKVKGRNVNAAAYKNRLWAYVEERLDAFDAEKKLVLVALNDLGSRLDKIDDLANKGLHAEINFLDLDRLLIALVTVTYDLLSLAAPPTKLPIEPHLQEFTKFVREL